MGPISSGYTDDDLVNFPGSKYADPKFSWSESVTPTDIEFFRSSNLGARYTNNILVGDITAGNLYFFEVNENRDGINLDATQQQSVLSDFVVDNADELSAITFGSCFGVHLILKLVPDGYLYISTYDEGIIYIISSTTAQ
jgi:hypothetical protein